jgi:hypothetical protein
MLQFYNCKIVLNTINSYHPRSHFAKNGGWLVPGSHFCGAGNIELFFGVYFTILST